MRSYATLNIIKSEFVLDRDNTAADKRLRGLIEAVTLGIERHVNRHFHVWEGERIFDGPGGERLWVPDLIAVTSIVADDSGATLDYEDIWDTDDYYLWPLDAAPTDRYHPNSRPYTAIMVETQTTRTYGSWPNSSRAIKVTGRWGYWEHLLTATEVVNEAVNPTVTKFKVTGGTDIEVGHTIKRGNEQMYVTDRQGEQLTVDRHANGTTGQTHAVNDTIQIYEYPGPIVEACIMQLSRLWKRKDSSFASTVGFADGSFQSFKGLDPDVQRMLRLYRKTRAEVWTP